MMRKMGEATIRITEDTSKSNKGLIVLVYKTDEVMCKGRIYFATPKSSMAERRACFVNVLGLCVPQQSEGGS